MEFFVVFVLLLMAELVYFKVAKFYNIIDKPNERSSHTQITLRGGGIIFYLATTLCFIWNGFEYPWFFLGLSLMAVISFLDDIYSISNRVRLIVHFIAVLLMAFELGLLVEPWFIIVACFIIIVGVINAYNFMDGINGITAIYSISVLALLSYLNRDLNFVNSDLLIYNLAGVLVFAIFNFRLKAKAFAGDVGSVSIAFIILFCLGSLILQTNNIIYILFLAVYGIDSIFTILNRLLNGKNIFEAHRSHLYQFLANEAKINPLFIAMYYGLLQIVIGILVIRISTLNTFSQIIYSLLVLLFLSGFYLFFKNWICKKYVIANNK